MADWKSDFKNNNMSKPTSYDLLLQINSRFDRLEDKLVGKIDKLDERVDVVETNTDRMMGKIGTGIFIITAIVAVVVSFVTDWLKKTFIK